MDIRITRSGEGAAVNLGGGPEPGSVGLGPGAGPGAGLDAGGPHLGGLSALPGHGASLGLGADKGSQLQIEAG